MIRLANDPPQPPPDPPSHPPRTDPPKDNRPPNKPPRRGYAEVLDDFHDLLRLVQLLGEDMLGVFAHHPDARMQITDGLRLAQRGLRSIAVREGHELPARQGDPSVAVAAAVGFPLSPDGPGSNHPLAPGEEPTPGSAVAALSGAAARESTRAVVADGAGADVPGAEGLGCKGRVVGADGAATFTNPNTRVPLSFDEGEHRLVGAVHQP